MEWDLRGTWKMNRPITTEICIKDYEVGGIFFYKIETDENVDMDMAVSKLMSISKHNESNCHWSTMSINDVSDFTNETIKVEVSDA